MGVKYPINLIDNIDSNNLQFLYELNDDDAIIKTNLDTKEKRVIKAQDYSRRVIILHDYLLQCVFLNISNELLICVNKNGETSGRNIMNLFQKHTSDDKKKQEKEFIKLYTDFLSGKQVDAKKFKDGYLLLFELNQSGGI